MFSGLRENSPIYILIKGERPELQIGTVVSVSNPSGGFGHVPGYTQTTTVEVTVRVGEKTFDIKALPSQQTSHLYVKENAFVTDNRQDMLMEVENMQRTSRAVLESMAYHEEVVNACDAMLVNLNHQIAIEREREERLDSMEDRIGGVEGDIKRVIGILETLTSGGGRKPKE